MKETVVAGIEQEKHIKTVPYDSLKNATYVHDSEFFDLTGCISVQELINHLLDKGMIDGKCAKIVSSMVVEEIPYEELELEGISKEDTVEIIATFVEVVKKHIKEDCI